jgi:hypothetical protein
MCPASPQSITRCAMLRPSAREIGPFVYIVSAEEIETVSSAIEFWLKTGVGQFLAKIAVTEP